MHQSKNSTIWQPLQTHNTPKWLTNVTDRQTDGHTHRTVFNNVIRTLKNAIWAQGGKITVLFSHRWRTELYQIFGEHRIQMSEPVQRQIIGVPCARF